MASMEAPAIYIFRLTLLHPLDGNAMVVADGPHQLLVLFLLFLNIHDSSLTEPMVTKIINNSIVHTPP